ncbi:MAG: tetratricopeptide repeat protein [Bacteroidetes bacterium]|nr:tetratricopeptide repeat protein [Bacteroidota bacterium]
MPGIRIYLFILSLFASAVFFSSCGGEKKAEEKTKTGQDTLTLLIRELDQKIADHPSDPDLYQQRSKYLLIDHQEQKAFNDITKAISLAPNKPALYIVLSDVYLGMGKPDNCNEALLKAISFDPKNMAALVRLAKLSLIIKDYKSTFEYIKKALEIEPDNPQVYFTRALALLEKGDTVKAVEDLKRTVDAAPEFYDAYIELGELYSMRKDPIGADYLRSALRLRPDSKEALYMLGMFYQETGVYEKAIATYEALAKIDTTFRDAPYNVGYIYLVYLGDYKKAADFFTESLKRDPGYVEALYNRGYAYELSGDFDKAYTDYKHVLTLKTNYEKAITGLNRIDKARKK